MMKWTEREKEEKEKRNIVLHIGLRLVGCVVSRW